MPAILAYYNVIKDRGGTIGHTGVTNQDNFLKLFTRSPSIYYSFDQPSNTTSSLIINTNGVTNIDVRMISIIGTNIPRDAISNITGLGGSPYNSASDGVTIIERVKYDAYEKQKSDLFIVLPRTVDGNFFRIQFNNDSTGMGTTNNQIGSIMMSEAIQISDQLDGYQSEASDKSVKVVSDGGQVTATKKAVLDRLSVSIKANEISTWGDPQEPTNCLNHMRKSSGVHTPIIYLRYNSNSNYTNKSIYGTLDSMNSFRLIKALDKDSGHWWETTIKITEEL